MRTLSFAVTLSLTLAAISVQFGCPHLVNGQVREIGNKRQLFMDDWIVESTANVERRPGTVVKNPANPVLRSDKPWDQFRADLYGSAVFDPVNNRLQVFYQADDSPYLHGKSFGYAESNVSGTSWTKPLMDLVPFGSYAQTNLLLKPAAGDANPYFQGPCVFRDEHESDPAKRYKLFDSEWYKDEKMQYLEQRYVDNFRFTTGSSVGKAGMYVAYSPDGIHWTRPSQQPVMDLLSDTIQSAFWDARLGKYVAYVRAILMPQTERMERAVGRIESDDFETWTAPQLVLQGTSLNRQIYSMGVTPYEGMYVGTPWIFNTNASGNDPVMWPELATSRDGIQWSRPFEGHPLIPTGAPDSPDSLQIRMSSSLVVLDDRILLIYGQSDDPHDINMGAEVGMATMRLDGFAFMEAGDQPGTILTKPFALAGDRLLVNAVCDAAKGGSIRVAVLDEAGNVKDGFSSELCAPVVGDGVHLPVVWGQGTSLDELRGQTVRLQFQMRNADLYSFAIMEALEPCATVPLGIGVAGLLAYNWRKRR